MNAPDVTEKPKALPAVACSDLLGCWAVAIQLQKRLENGSLDLAVRLGKWDANSEQEAVGKAVDNALENNKGYTVGIVTRLIIKQPNDPDQRPGDSNQKTL